MPDVLSALIAFVAEHRHCGNLDGGIEGGVVWLGCTCSARLARSAAGPSAAPNSARRADPGPADR
jgi:hypothetical protein